MNLVCFQNNLESCVPINAIYLATMSIQKSDEGLCSISITSIHLTSRLLVTSDDFYLSRADIFKCTEIDEFCLVPYSSCPAAVTGNSNLISASPLRPLLSVLWSGRPLTLPALQQPQLQQWHNELAQNVPLSFRQFSITKQKQICNELSLVFVVIKLSCRGFPTC